MGVTWELVRNAESWATSDLLGQNLRVTKSQVIHERSQARETLHQWEQGESGRRSWWQAGRRAWTLRLASAGTWRNSWTRGARFCSRGTQCETDRISDPEEVCLLGRWSRQPWRAPGGEGEEVLLSSGPAVRTAQIKGGVVRKIRGQWSNLEGISEHIPLALVPNWALRKVKRKCRWFWTAKLWIVPQPSVGMLSSHVFLCYWKRRYIFLVMVVLPKGNFRLKVPNLYVYVNFPCIYIMREFFWQAISYSETVLHRVLLFIRPPQLPRGHLYR